MLPWFAIGAGNILASDQPQATVRFFGYGKVTDLVQTTSSQDTGKTIKLAVKQLLKDGKRLHPARQVLELYRERYFDCNVRHFHEKLEEEHGIGLSYSWVKAAL